MTKNAFASILVLGLGTAAVGCGGLPGMECKFAKGEVVAEASGDAKAFLSAAMDLKKAVDSLEADWSAEIKAIGGELQVDPASGEEGVLAKISANVSELKAEGQCTVAFKADLDAGASGSAAGDAKASSDSGSSSSGGATGAAHADVKVDFKLDCKAEAKVKAKLDVTTAAITVHFPKLLGIVVSYKGLVEKIKAVGEQGSKVMGAVGSDIKMLSEVKCAVEATTGIKVDARVSFSVKAEASAKGEAKAGS